MKKKLGIMALLALTALIPTTACGNKNNDSGSGSVVDDTTLESVKSNAKIGLDTYLASELAKNNVTDEGNQISTNINAYKNRIDSATNVDDIRSILEDGKSYIDLCIATLVEEALNEAKDQACASLTSYTNDKAAREGITIEETISAALTSGKSLINNANSIDDVQSALTTAKANIDSVIQALKDQQANQALLNKKTTAKAELDTYVQAKLAEKELTMNAALETIVNEQKSLIDSATTISAVDEALVNAKAAVDNKIAEMKSNSDLSTEKSNAINTLKEYKNEKLGTLTDDGSVAAALATGIENINASVNVEGVNSAVVAAKADIDSAVAAIKAVVDLANAKTNAIASLNEYAQTKLGTLTDDGTVLAAKNSGITAINASTTTAAVEVALTSAKANIDSAVEAIKAAVDLANAKATANTAIEAYAAEKLTAAGITDSEGLVAAKVAEIQESINTKTTIKDVNDRLASGKTEIDTLISNLSSMSEADKLAALKESAVNTLNSYAQDKLGTLTDDGSVATAVTNGTTAINNATDAAGVNNALEAAKANVDSRVAALQAAKELAAAKANAVSELDAYASTALGALTDDGSVELAVTNGTTAINSAADVTGVNSALEAAKTNVDNAVSALQAAKELAAAKATAISELREYASTALGTLTDDGSVAQAVTNGTTAINDATNVAGINSALAQAKTNVDNAVLALQAAKELADAKTNAISELQSYKTAQLTAKGVTDDGSVELAVTNGTTAINAAATTADVTSALTSAKANIDSAIAVLVANKEAQELATAKESALSELNTYYTSAISGITDDGTVLAAKNNGVTAINDATTKTEVATALATAKTNIDNAKAVILSAELENYKTTKKTELNTYASNALTAAGVTDDGTVSKAIENGIVAINASTSKTAVDSALASAKNSVDSAIQRIVTGSEYAEDVDDPSNLGGNVVTQGSIEIVESSGWLESGYVKFKAVSGASGYNVYYKIKGSSDSSYKKLDDMLIRNYGSYIRADVLGLKAGSYILKVVAVKSGAEVADTASTVQIKVTAQQREGFAFASYSTFKSAGAYNSDGTVSSNTTIVYLTNENCSSITATINGISCTGIQAIIDAQAKAAKAGSASPLIIRMIGEIKASNMGSNLNSSTYLQLKGGSSYSNMKLTFEGVGDDAWCNGWGLLLRNAGNVEVRNIAVRDFGDDGISLDTDNCNVWVHNCDFFYGKQQSGDKAKGDGSLDVKGDSQYITFSYNHFFDTGKVSLCGMTSETGENWITYHHNWFDHSDSRHPRIRTMSVHVYNNYYDGNAKYGVGAALDSNAFVEGNYFDNCKYPMLISLQGHDYYDYSTNTNLSKGTFSGESGGMIKAYENTIVGSQSKYQPYVAGDSVCSVQYDAIEVSSRTETIPSSIKNTSGNSYNNFDTQSNFLNGYVATVDRSTTVPDTVKAYSGRMMGGDFSFEFTEADDSDYNINTSLRSALDSYSSSLVSVLGSTYVVSATATDDMVEVVTTDDYIDAVNKLGSSAEYTSAYKAKLDEANSIYESLDSSDKSSVSSYYSIYTQRLSEYNTLKAAQEQAEIDNVIALINAIGTVDSTSGTKITAARTAYNSLTSAQQALVTNYATLTAAESAYSSYAVDAVIGKIDALTDASTATTRTEIESLLVEYNSVLAEYNNLTSTQQGQVTNASKLTTGITTLESALAPYEVMDLIDAIGTVDLTSSDKITAARTAYNSLTSAQQSLVTNYATLTAAEAAYQELAAASITCTFEGSPSNSAITVSGKYGSTAATINGESFAKGLKMETSTSVTFTTSTTKTLTLYVTAGQKIKVDGTSYTVPSDGILVIENLAAGSHTISKDTTNTLLYKLIIA